MAQQSKVYKKFVATAATATLVATAIVPAVSADVKVAASDFTDVNENYKEAVEYLVSVGAKGVTSTQFGISHDIKRADAAILIASALGILDEKAPASGFTDVPARAAVAVNSLKAAGIVSGKTATSFGVDDALKRGEVALILANAKAYNLKGDVSKLEFTDVKAVYAPAVAGMVEAKVTSGISKTQYGTDLSIKRGDLAKFLFGLADEIDKGDPAVVSVTAVNKTTVEVKFNKVVDSAKAADFTIAGASVTAATLSEDKKTATLTVSGLDYATEYTLASTVLIDGKETELAETKFTTPAIADLWNLVVETQEASLTANGSDNTPVTFKLVDKVTGQVDENADNVVLKVSTTHGTLANERITIQDGKGTTTLTSEFSNKNVTAKIDAQIIEASGDYSELIGKVIGTANVQFKVTSSEDVTIKTMVAADSNQADRVTLFFDNNVNLMDFVQTTVQGSLLYTLYQADGKTVIDNTDTAPVTGDSIKKLQALPANKGSIVHHALKKEVLKVTQAATGEKAMNIQGVKPVSGNSKAIEVILANPNLGDSKVATNQLTDNQKVDVTAKITNSLNKQTESKADFILTDARNPEVTSVKAEGMNKVVVQFSESVADGDVRFDGLAATANDLLGSAGALNDVVTGDFNALTLQDTRDVATITLDNAYTKAIYGGAADGYFKAGSHSLQVSNLVDHAFATDSKNKGTTQTLQFSVKEDGTLPAAKVVTQSAEQYIVNFDKVLKEFNSDDVKLQVFDPESGEWGAVEAATTINGKTVFSSTPQKITTKALTGGEYKVEVVEDWNKVLVNDNDHYSNYKFRLFVGKGNATNAANGLVNKADIALDLSYTGSHLTKVDNTSPVISNIDATTNFGEYVVTMSEPVKIDATGNGFPVTGVTTVEFQGKDKDGKTVVVAGKVKGYADFYDKAILVEWDKTATKSPQQIVDEGGSPTWTVVAKSVSDDLGNTAATLSKDFTIVKTADSVVPFTITDVTYGANGASDNEIHLTFSTAVVHTGGVNDATALANYSLNGLNLPAGSSIAVEEEVAKKGYNKVIITVPAGTLAEITPATPTGTDTITVNKNLLNQKNVKLTGLYEWVVAGEGTDTIPGPVDPGAGEGNMVNATDFASDVTVNKPLGNTGNITIKEEDIKDEYKNKDFTFTLDEEELTFIYKNGIYSIVFTSTKGVAAVKADLKVQVK